MNLSRITDGIFDQGLLDLKNFAPNKCLCGPENKLHEMFLIFDNDYTGVNGRTEFNMFWSFRTSVGHILSRVDSSRLDLEKNLVDSSRPSRFPTLFRT
ncbi:hypothetical protein BpHYR1_012447 [Brachionus plicatilis]|uniref:EF-hand domain-containing protein n=1 Tax=Brachionus plicatilis TaxID=10195 RepID=A0A3M7P487_BRAPC|nr:hypothetical protein BpHYR1_012447 [Brachionus plicatilis]